MRLHNLVAAFFVVVAFGCSADSDFGKLIELEKIKDRMTIQQVEQTIAGAQ
jgi:hypothetical protein